MVILLVRRNLKLKKSQRGISLIELMIASIIGIMTLLSVGSIFISGQKVATERSQRLFVLQSINEALRYIKEDVQRAGFNGSHGQSFILSGANSVITATSKSLAYGYQTGLNGSTLMYKQVAFIYKNNNIRVCERAESSAPLLISCGTKLNPSFSLFDENRIKINSFNIVSQALGSTVSSALYTITLQASLLDGSHQQTMSTQIKQRNWK